MERMTERLKMMMDRKRRVEKRWTCWIHVLFLGIHIGQQDLGKDSIVWC